MSRETSPYQELVNARAHNQRVLFGEEYGMEPASITATKALASVCERRRTQENANWRMPPSTLGRAVLAVVEAHNNAATIANYPALFGLRDAGDVPLVAEVAAEILDTCDTAIQQRHQISLGLEGLPEHVDPSQFSRVDVQLVIEAAAAAIQALQHGYSPRLLPHVEQWPPPPQLTPHQEWLQHRSDYRTTLFAPAPPNQPLPWSKPRNEFSVAALAMLTNFVAMPNATHTQRLLHQNTAAILHYHNELAHSPDDTEALFAIPKLEDLDTITALTAHMLGAWHRAQDVFRPWKPHDVFARLADTPLGTIDLQATDVRLTIEAASAVSEIINLGYPTIHILGTPLMRQYALFIARRGPEYARRWIEGDIVREYCCQNNLNPQEWEGLLTRNEMGRLAINYQLDPMKRYKHVHDALQTVLTPQNLQALTGWPPKLLKKVFPSYILGSIAAQNNNPAARVVQIARTLDTTLHSQNLAAALNLTPKQVDFYIPTWSRVLLARSTNTPLRPSVIPRIISVCNELMTDFDLDPDLAVWLANQHRGKAIHRARQIRAEWGRHPQSVTDQEWARAVARYPTPGDPRRMREIALFRAWREIHGGHVPLTDLHTGDRPLEGRTITAGMRDLDPAELVASAHASEQLLAFAKSAGISASRIEALLRYITTTGDTPTSGPLADIIHALRRAAES